MQTHRIHQPTPGVSRLSALCQSTLASNPASQQAHKQQEAGEYTVNGVHESMCVCNALWHVQPHHNAQIETYTISAYAM